MSDLRARAEQLDAAIFDCKTDTEAQDVLHAALLQVERETIARCIAECGKVRNLQAGLCIERLRALQEESRG